MKYLYILTFCFLLNYASGQNLEFSYTVETTSPTTRTLSFFAQSTAGAETIQTGSWRMYYNSAKTSFTSGDPGPLGFGFSFNDQIGTNPAAVGADMYVDLNGFTFVPVNIPDATPVLIYSIVMENVSPDEDPANTVYYVTTVEDPVVAYSGSGGSGNPIVVTGPQEQILPIELSKFEAKKTADRNVELNWSTSSEINASHFVVERSQNGEAWTTIGKVDAVGESSVEQNYFLLDNDLPLNSRVKTKTFYYRLDMVDNDGSQEYSDTRVVRFDIDGDANLLVYPNPATNSIFVNLSSITSETGPAVLNLFSSTGQLMKKQSLSTNDDIQVDIHNLPAGIYYFMVKHQNETFTEKVILID